MKRTFTLINLINWFWFALCVYFVQTFIMQSKHNILSCKANTTSSHTCARYRVFTVVNVF